MKHIHTYNAIIEWTGNTGATTSAYTSYERSHDIKIAEKEIIKASSDKAFRGDSAKHNPEDLFVSAIASCHMLWYLHLCADAGVLVESYIDNAVGKMETTNAGDGKFVSITLHPTIMVQQENMIEHATMLHEKAHQMCFLANSVNFEILIEPNIKSV